MAVVGRDTQVLDQVVRDIVQSGGRAIGAVADCTVEADLGWLATRVADELGPVDIIAAFAGGNGMPVPTVDETAAHWREIVESDLTSMFLTVHAFLPDMVQRNRGAIITMSSAAARQAARSAAAYAAAKAGVIAFTRHLAAEVGPNGIRVNCIAPSAVENDKMRAWMSAEQRQALGESFPLRRIR